MSRVKIYGISMVRNEADIIGVTVAHHLSLGLDNILSSGQRLHGRHGRSLRNLARKDRRVNLDAGRLPFDQAA